MPWNDWLEVVRLVEALDGRRYDGRWRFTDADIVLVLLWSVAHRRPVAWACTKEAWPIFTRARGLPSQSRVSRRLASAHAARLRERVLTALLATPGLVAIFDGTAIEVASHSGDRDATFGSAKGRRRGYKLHLCCDDAGNTVARRVTPLHEYEPKIAGRMAGTLGPGYALGDANYDSGELYGRLAQQGVQLVAPRRESRAGKGLRKRGVPACRKRGIAILEHDRTGFGQRLYAQRRAVERLFGRLETRFGIGHPPAWVRTLPRVRRWVDAILILDALAQQKLRRNAA